MLAYQPALAPTLAYARTSSSCWPLVWAALWTVLLAAAPWLPEVRFVDNPAAYLPLHMALEFISMAVCAMVVTLGWNLIGSRQNSHVAILGAGFLHIGLAVFAHTLSYKGMPDFVTASGPEKGIYFWLAERLGGALCILALFLLPVRQWSPFRCRLTMFLAALAAAATWWIGLFHGDWLPRTFVEGLGLTAFKINAEYFFSALYAVVGVLLLRRGGGTQRCLGAAAWSLALAGLFFTLYGNVTDILNVLGHACKASAYWMIYRALFADQIQAPARALVEQESRLEQQVETRTQELRRALGQFRIFVEQAPTAIAMFDRDMNYVAASVRWMQTYGGQPGELIGRGLYEGCPDLPASWREASASAAAGHSREAAQECWLRADGEERWLRWAAYPWRDEADRIGGVILAAEDITGLKTVEAALGEEKRFSDDIINSLPGIFYMLDQEGRYVRWNRRFCEVTGYKADELGNMKVLQTFDPATASLLQKGIDETFERGEAALEAPLLTKDGRRIDYLFTGHRTSIGDRLYLVGLAIDISERKAAEAQVLEQEARFRQLSESLPQLVWTCGTGGACDYVSPQWGAYTGLPAQATLGAGWLDSVHPEDRESTRAAWFLAQGGSGSGLYDVEFRLRRHDGVYRWFRSRAVPLTGQDGKILKWFGTSTDVDELKQAITERKATELAIRRSEENLRLALSAARMSVFEHDLAAGRMRHRGPGSHELGLPESFPEGDFFARIHPEDRPGFLAAIRSPCPGEPTYHHEYRFRMPDGAYRWLADKAQGHFDADGRLLRLIGVYWDVTDRKSSEHHLKRHAERQIMLLEIASTLLLAWHDRTTLARTLFERIRNHLDADLGLYFRTDARSDRLALVASFGIGPEDEASVRYLQVGQGVCGRVAASGKFISLDAQSIEEQELAAFIRGMGIRAYTCHPLLATDGTLLGTFSLGSRERTSFTPEEIDFLRTVTYLMALSLERLQAKMEIERLNGELERRVEERTAELEAANRELHGFTYAASHDMKGPLGRINSFSALLERNYRDRLDGEGLIFLDFIRRNARRLSTLLDDLLSHAQIEQSLLNLEPVDVGAVVHLVLDEMAEDIRDIGTVLELRLPERPLRVLANQHGLTQVLRNLIGNAIKYSVGATPPAIEIGARLDGDTCRVWVEDNGVGFDMVYHDKIFEIFRRLHTYDEFPGSGVGLALVRKAMDRMQGKVWAESAPGQGATFFLEFRAVAGDALRPLPEPAGTSATVPGC